MLKVKFFHTPRNKKFNYSPLYYDPEEEERKKRIEKITGKSAPGESIKHEFTRRRKQQKKSGRVSNTRAFIIIVILLLIAYYLIFDEIPFIN
ncbi:hypothetical protein [Salinivirga cyanobacteriivorans]|uniref:Riboflavin synthase subunit beta n=1 Tax=Salinivirga cyanobacteriivorans TaxID=1307839 RepID=A0A0S2HYD5_9BACT|nr:hypothetical protein [Salinivirga cyanobacteriivorans]ALO14978.1 hypothetical protein L21SP5_01327 [Salinivirga cyanobacteriivorans]